MGWTDRQRSPANQGAGFERLLGHGADDGDAVAAAHFDEVQLGMGRLLDAEHAAWGVDPTLGEFDLVRREHSALCHQETARDVAFVECDVGWDVGRLEHLEQVWCFETARHFRDDGVRQERVGELHEPHHLEVQPGGSVVERVQLIAEMAVLVLLARATRAGVVSASDLLGSQRSERGDLFGKLGTETLLARDRVVGGIKVDLGVHACSPQEVTRLNRVAAVSLECSKVDQDGGVAAVADRLK